MDSTEQAGYKADNTITTLQNIHNPDQSVTDPDVSLQLLKYGNKRYVENKTIARDTNNMDRTFLKDGQKPFAVILTCSDSRVPPEIYFDQKLGDIFVIRNAGDIADSTALGSIEYAVGYLNVPLVCVIGHSKCGAVTAAFCGGEAPVNLQSIINAIKANISKSADVADAIHDNINGMVEIIKQNSIIADNNTTVAGAYYDIETGVVTWTR